MKKCSKIFQKRIVEPKSGLVLKDARRSRKIRDWKRYKEQSLAVSFAYTFFEELTRYSEKIASCGSYLQFLSCPEGHTKRLMKAYFCRCRLCTMCQWRKSLVIFHQVLGLVHAHKECYISDRPLLLTLTVPNVKASELSSCIDRLTRGWKNLSNRKIFKNSIRSWFRALEVTYNEERNDYHPHLHILLIVPKGYFARERGLYIERDKFLSMWQEVTGLSEVIQVDIRAVRKKKRKAIEAISAEVSKYAVKPDSYIKSFGGKGSGKFKVKSEVLEVLHRALRGRRLVAVGGLFTEFRKKLKLDDVEKADLVHIAGDEKPCVCEICQSTLIEEIYRWQIGVRQYLKET